MQVRLAPCSVRTSDVAIDNTLQPFTPVVQLRYANFFLTTTVSQFRIINKGEI